MDLVDRMRQNYNRQEDKEQLLKTAFAIYEGAVQTALALNHQTQQDSFLHQVFTAFEKSSSMILLESMTATDAINFAAIPEDLLAQEQDLSTQLAFYEKSLFEEKLKKEKADTSKIAIWQDEVFGLRQTDDSITQVLETQHPEYYRLKYDASVAGIGEIQQALTPNQSLVEYLLGDSGLFVFVIRPDTFIAWN